MLEKDSIILGILLGLVIPFVGYAVFLMLLEVIGIEFRSRTTALFAICLNLIPFVVWKGNYRYETMRGIVFPTVAYVGIWFVKFSSSFFGL